MSQKAKYWWGVLYPENMIDDWQSSISEITQLPGAYCIHDKDSVEEVEEERKTHLHLILVFNNTTTYKHALSVFQSLSKSGFSCCNTIKSVISVDFAYNYLIHDTEDCRKKGKYQYPINERVLFNNFDIGSYVQMSVDDKNEILKAYCKYILDKKIKNFGDFFLDVVFSGEFSNLDFQIIKENSGLLERLTKSNYQKYFIDKEIKNKNKQLYDFYE